MRTDGRTVLKKLIVALRNLTKAPKKTDTVLQYNIDKCAKSAYSSSFR